MKEPQISVGILRARQVVFSFSSPYTASGGESVTGTHQVAYRKGKICWQGATYDRLEFWPTKAADSFFELQDVVIGIEFHWERKEVQRFCGGLLLMVEAEAVRVVNRISVEEYLCSVISSEMSAAASPALLQAHAVISRSWLLAQLQRRDVGAPTGSHLSTPAAEGERICWYDREAHTHFDVCADDHCQRYQGITRASTPQAAAAVAATRGQVLTYRGSLCDARFSKCCGGAFEEFGSCWEEQPHPYLRPGRDSRDGHPLPDLRIEAEADRWIRSTPPAFCHTQDRKILDQVLNGYDRETPDFYRWQVSYTQTELSTLIRRRAGIDFGAIIDLQPLQRGSSGRIVRLRIVGTRQSLIIGKELEIRRTLSPSHLYSSAFVVDKEGDGPVPARFLLTGAGWGHGVGLCQIGAAMMGQQGYGYQEILAHYYPGSNLCKQYE